MEKIALRFLPHHQTSSRS